MTDLLVRVGTRGRYTIPGSGITGTAGVWTDVTPAGISLVGTDNGGDNYGVQDILADPVTAGKFYAFVCYQGCWTSLDYGLTWAKVSGTSVLNGGKNWGSAIAPDGSYLLNTCGNNLTGSPQVRMTVQKSTDAGATWSTSASLSADPYNVEVSPYDKTRAICAAHDTGNLYESLDSGASWSDMGLVNAAVAASGYAHYLHNSDTVLYVGQNSEGVYRGTKSAGTWTFSAVSDLSGGEHSHGVHQIFYDVTNGAFFHGSGSTNLGIYKSTNNGVNWTRYYSTEISDAIIGTATTLYSMRSFPINTGTYAPKWTTATRNPGTSWATAIDPSGMGNGAKRFATATDGARTVVLAGCWCGGIWRYIE